MQGLLIADNNLDSRRQMADLFIEAGYNVMVANTAEAAIHGIVKKSAQVVLIGNQLEDLSAIELVPLLKECDRNLSIIVVGDDIPLPLARKLREQGIFYHAFRPEGPEACEEIRQVVRCAFTNLTKGSQKNTQ
jgi:DNA-binding NtrC family response regulator